MMVVVGLGMVHLSILDEMDLATEGCQYQV